MPLLIGTTRNEGSIIPLVNNDLAGRPLNANTYTSEVAHLLSAYLPVGSGLSAFALTQLYPLREYATPRDGRDAACWTDQRPEFESAAA